MQKPRINAIVAHTRKDRVIGKDGSIPWYYPEDLKHFKEITSNHTVIMGRKTWESLPEKFRPLPGRKNIVITRDLSYEAPSAEVFDSLEKSLEDDAFIIGGATLYAQALPFIDTLYVTVIEKEFEGDTFFPPYEDKFELIEEKKEGDLTFQTLKRKAASLL